MQGLGFYLEKTRNYATDEYISESFSFTDVLSICSSMHDVCLFTSESVSRQEEQRIELLSIQLNTISLHWCWSSSESQEAGAYWSMHWRWKTSWSVASHNRQTKSFTPMGNLEFPFTCPVGVLTLGGKKHLVENHRHRQTINAEICTKELKWLLHLNSKRKTNKHGTSFSLSFTGI